MLAPKPGRLERVDSFIQAMSDSESCTAAQAATLLGKCGFIGTQLQGRVLRFAERPLIDRQYSKLASSMLSDKLRACLRFVQEAFRRLPARRVLMGRDGPLSVMYSDAAFTEGKPISFGWVLFCPGQRPRAGAGIVPPELSEQFKERKTQIFIGELLAALSALHICGPAVQHHRALHFIDNQGALAALMGGFQPTQIPALLLVSTSFWWPSLGVGYG